MTKLSSTKHAIQDLKAIGQMVFSISSLIGNLIPKRWVAYYITWYRPEHLHHHGAKDINHITRSPSLYSQFFNLCWDPVSFCPIRYRDCQRHVVFQYNEYCAQRSTWRRDASALEGYCLPTDCQDSCRYWQDLAHISNVTEIIEDNRWKDAFLAQQSALTTTKQRWKSRTDVFFSELTDGLEKKVSQGKGLC